MNENDDKADSPKQYDPANLRRDRQSGYVSVWSPTLSEKERAEREQQIADGIIPF